MSGWITTKVKKDVVLKAGKTYLVNNEGDVFKVIGWDGSYPICGKNLNKG